MGANDLPVRNGKGADHKPRGRKPREQGTGHANVQNAVQRADLMEMDGLRLHAVYGGFGLRQQRERIRGQALRPFVHAAPGDDSENVLKRAVLVLAGKRHFREPAADAVHLTPLQAHGSGQIGKHGGKQPVRFRLVGFRHAQQPGKEHVPRQAGM